MAPDDATALGRPRRRPPGAGRPRRRPRGLRGARGGRRRVRLRRVRAAPPRVRHRATPAGGDRRRARRRWTRPLDEGLEGDALAFYHVDPRRHAAGDRRRAGARAAFEAALAARAGPPGRPRRDRAPGRVRRPASTRRSPASTRRSPRSRSPTGSRAGPTCSSGEPAAGDAAQAATDRVDHRRHRPPRRRPPGASTTGPARSTSPTTGSSRTLAVRLATDELATRKDVYGYDALAWALLNAGQAAGGPAAADARGAGRRDKDARIWYHAGLIEAATGDRRAGARAPRGRASRSGRPWIPSPATARPRRWRRCREARRARARSPRCCSRPSRRPPRSAHPLGNFTINHYAGIRVEPDRILLDVVIDEAEIPAFQATPGPRHGRRRPDLRGRARPDGGASLPRGGPGARPHGRRRARGPDAHGGGGLAPAGQRRPVDAATRVQLRGARAIAAAADGLAARRLRGRPHRLARDDRRRQRGHPPHPGLAATSASARLTAYPVSLASAPDVRELTLDVRPGGPVLPDLPVPDAAQVEPVTVDGSGQPPAVGETVTGSNPGQTAVPVAGSRPRSRAARMRSPTSSARRR